MMKKLFIAAIFLSLLASAHTALADTCPSTVTNSCPTGQAPYCDNNGVFLTCAQSDNPSSTISNKSQTAGGKLNYVPLEPLPGFPTNVSSPQSLQTVLISYYKILLGFGAMFSVLLLILGGISYMTTEAVGQRVVAKQRIVAALMGMLLLLCSYLILATINPKQLLNLSLSIAPTTITGAQQKSATNNISYQDAIKQVEADRYTASPEAQKAVQQEIQTEEAACSGNGAYIQSLATTGPGGCQNMKIQDDISGTDMKCTPIADGVTGKYCISK
jgi:hypothetical protein